MLDPHREIQALVDNFVADLSELAKRIAIEQIKEAFGVGAKLAAGVGGARQKTSASTRLAAPPSVTPARAGRGRRGHGDGQSELEQLRGKLLAAISDQPGRRTEDLNATLGTRTPQIAQLLRRLVAEKVVRTEGARRGTRYYVVGPGDGQNGRRSSSSSSSAAAAAVAAAAAEAAATAAEEPASPVSPAR
ncbi:MAG TPA: hypothetical protein VFT22_28600 [Kofleriaceae bacterium]|nr:hypothetical protein [Kofleriaceae bacterium]